MWNINNKCKSLVQISNLVWTNKMGFDNMRVWGVANKNLEDA
jgi:hypothetical protein